MTLGAYAVDWLRQSSLDLRPSTSEFYRYSLRHLDPIADLPIDAVTPAHVRGLLETAHRQGKASRTIRGIAQTLRLVLRRAEADGLVDRNVAALVRLPKLETKEPKHFTAEQARRFLEVAEDDELGSLYAVALGTGLRRGELLGLAWRDVELDGAARIQVRQSKTASGVRVVPLTGIAATALRRMDRRPGPIWPYRPEYVSNHFQDICRLAGVPVLTMHSTRHTAATIMLNAGVPIEVIRSILGHTTVSMSSHYARPEDQLRREAVDLLSGTIAGHQRVANDR